MILAFDPDGVYLPAMKSGPISAITNSGLNTDSSKGDILLINYPSSPGKQDWSELFLVIDLIKIMQTINTMKDTINLFQTMDSLESWSVFYNQYCWSGPEIANNVSAIGGIILPIAGVAITSTYGPVVNAIVSMGIHTVMLDAKYELSKLPGKYSIRFYRFPIPFTFWAVQVMGRCDDTPTVTPISNASIVSVSGSQGWQSTGIKINQGQSFQIIYMSGSWAGRVGWGPSLPDIWTDAGGIDFDIYYPEFGRTGKFASLIGQIGNGPIFQVGRRYSAQSSQSGILSLRMFDTDMSDNDGSINVQIIISP
jgi:hypothetical protein